ncbi:MAG: hypothetical protein KBC05_19010 [Candidatus Hydrogenedentes bacterium]|nr:hypothetical protein [Candidatus Hydrogenedentota bacterium]
MNPLQRFGVFLANRLGGSTFAHDWGASGFAPEGEKKPRNPADAIGDPLRSLTLETVRNDYRLKINRGDLAFPTWALHEALRTLPIIGNYERMFCDAVAGMDWEIKHVEGSDEKKVLDQEKTLRKAYNGLDVPEVIAHLARANLYGYSVMTRRGTKLEPLDWWNILRHGLNGGWYWNPSARSQVLREDMPAGDVTPIETGVSVIREVRNPCLLEYLAIYLSARENEAYWDRFNERRSWNQVVLRLAAAPKGKELEYTGAAENIARGRPGWISKGASDNPTEIHWPPAQPDPQNFKERLLYLDAQACKVLFGSSLIANTAPDSGTLAGGAHSETAQRRIQAVALDISLELQRQYDAAVLREAGLLAEGEEPAVYFELVDRNTVDPDKEIAWTGTLAAAGYRRDVEELSGRTGMTLTEAPAQPIPGQGFAPMLPNRSGRLGDLKNRTPAEALRDLGERVAVARLAEWDAPARVLFERLAKRIEEGEWTPAALEKLQADIDALTVDDVTNPDALADFLERAMAGAMVEAVEDKTRVVQP